MPKSTNKPPKITRDKSPLGNDRVLINHRVALTVHKSTGRLWFHGQYLEPREAFLLLPFLEEYARSGKLWKE